MPSGLLVDNGKGVRDAVVMGTRGEAVVTIVIAGLTST
jgi:hypothetical protein